MSSVFSGNFSGSFTSTGAPRFIPLPSGCDFMRVYNETVSYATGAGTGAEFHWRRGMTPGQGTIYTKTATTQALTVGQITANNGFYMQDFINFNPGPLVALTAISTGTPPVVSTTSTAGLTPGAVVRLVNVAGAQQLGGLDFTVGTVVSNTSFTLANMSPLAVAGTAGSYRIIPYNPYFYPTTRLITNISNATQAIVTFAVSNIFTVGQKIRLVIPTVTAAAYGMTQANEKEVTVVAVGAADVNGYTNTVTIDLDTTSFTPFAFTLTANYPAGFPQAVPVGENTAAANFFDVNPFKDATINQGAIGMLLMAGTLSPAGVTGNVISWEAGKSYNGF